MARISDTVRKLSSYRGLREKPEGFDAFWVARAEHAAQARQVTSAEVGLDSPAATYRQLAFPSTDGRMLRARYVAPKCQGLVPTAVMFHDFGRGPRGWLHLTRFVAMGYAVLQLENRLWSGNVTEGWEAGPSGLAFAQVISDALVTANVALALPKTDTAHVVAWGEGLGAALTIDAAALVPSVRKVAACNPLPADFQAAFQHNANKSLYAGLVSHFRVADPLAKDAQELFGVLDYVDTVNFSVKLGSDLLLGTGLMNDTSFVPGQFAIFNRASCPKRQVRYPKWGHERINDFEDEVLRFLHP